MAEHKTLIRIAIAAALLCAATATATVWALTTLRLRILLPEAVQAQLRGPMRVRATVQKPLNISMAQDLTANVRLGTLSIPLDETLKVPLKLTVDVPIDTEIAIDQDVPIALTVPVDLVLTERELDLSKLEIPLDTEIFVDDVIALDLVVPIDTEIETVLGVKVPVKANVPVKMKVPIKQKVRVRDTLRLGRVRMRLPLKMQIPIRATLPLHQRFKVKGQVRAPIDQTLTVRLNQTIHPKIDEAVTATVRIEGQVPAQLRGELDAEVTLDHPLTAHLDAMEIAASDVSLAPKPDKPTKTSR